MKFSDVWPRPCVKTKWTLEELASSAKFDFNHFSGFYDIACMICWLGAAYGIIICFLQIRK